MAKRSSRSNRTTRTGRPGRARRPRGARRPSRPRRTRFVFPAAASLLFGCVDPCSPPDAGPHARPPGPICPDVDMPPPDMVDACSMWVCKQDADCPPSLCPTAYGFGTCRSGTCVWK